MRILEAVAVGLGLPPHHFNSLHTERVHELRLLHYPEVSVKEISGSSKTRTAEHTDFGSITLLFQDEIGGLEGEDQHQKGLFHPIGVSRPTMIINVGDSMQH
jgi:isopenicillin N synthase-like dioxygenase